jgi:succinate dehydrogenase / fumarate reductase iron-sulfur subunit
VNFHLEVYRQERANPDSGHYEHYDVEDIDEEASILEMLDQLNETLIHEGKEAIAFDSDCREGICGTCSLVIDGLPHGPEQVTTCQVYMRQFQDGQTIKLDPFRAGAFDVVKDLVADRSPLDKIIQAGGYVSVTTGPQPEPNSMPIPSDVQVDAMDAAICIGCGACVAACPNGAAMLFTGAKVKHLSLMPQGQAERATRAVAMVEAMDELGFGSCTNYGECARVCPQEIGIDVIGTLNREYRRGFRKPTRARKPKQVAI